DRDGQEIWIYYQVTSATGAVTTNKVQYKGGKLYEPGGRAYTGTNAYVAAVKGDLDKFKTDHPEAAHRLNVLEKSSQIHTIENTTGYNGNTATSASDDRAGRPTGSKTEN